MKIQIAFFILIAALCQSCKKDNDLKSGTIIGYVHSESFYTDNERIEKEIIGIYILLEHRDTLLAFNIPDATLNPILGVDIKTLSFVDRKVSKIRIPVSFDFRYANETELKEASVSNENFLLNLHQVVVTEIQKSKKVITGGTEGIPSCCL